MADTYKSLKDQLADKALLEEWRVALEVTPGAMKLDDCRCWTLQGKHGYAATWGDGRSLMLVVSARSALAWSWAKKRLGFCAVTQDGDGEGVLRLLRTPTAAEAVEIRDLVGLRKDISDDFREALRQRAHAAGLGRK